MKKRKLILVVMVALLFLSLACDDVVIDDTGVGRERDVMIYDASQNAP